MSSCAAAGYGVWYPVRGEERNALIDLVSGSDADGEYSDSDLKVIPA